jgi:hypothetical protein
VFRPETVKNPNTNHDLLPANTGKEGPIFQKSFIEVFFSGGGNALFATFLKEMADLLRINSWLEM